MTDIDRINRALAGQGFVDKILITMNPRRDARDLHLTILDDFDSETGVTVVFKGVTDLKINDQMDSPALFVEDLNNGQEASLSVQEVEYDNLKFLCRSASILEEF